MYLVDKVQKKVDEKLGVVETNEFVVMAADTQPPKATTSGPSVEKPASPANTSAAQPSIAPTTAPRPSVFASTVTASATPFLHPSATPAPVARPTSKADLETQLAQLRVKQQQLQQELQSGTSFRDVDDVEVEIRLLDQQKAQLKRTMKRL